ncbi:MAG TPA: dTDP-4-dehydrorhamnose reductase [Acidimicrobiales bacterium]|nr:dTDP-4-dehydrorhamnose reductase [Acidimicrobiales bacterium]
MALRLLVTGAGGQLGREVVALGGIPTTVDVRDRDAVLAAVSELRPDRIVHCAAYTDVDGCELDPDRAYAVNALGTRHVVEAARLVGAHVTCISTDYVFDGDSTRPYTEWDDVRPVSAYGASKLAGEREVGPADAVVRTSWLCGRYGTNFVTSVLKLARERGGDFTMVDDQVGCPTLADDLAAVVVRLSTDARPGVFHVTNQGAVSRYEFAREIVRAAGLEPVFSACKTADLQPPRPARRPSYSVLDNAALRLSGLPLLPDFRPSLQRLVKELS